MSNGDSQTTPPAGVPWAKVLKYVVPVLLAVASGGVLYKMWPAPGESVDPVPLRLDLEGDTYTVVRKAPFKVHGPKGADVYFWQIPAGVSALDKGGTLEVAGAPQGEVTVGLKTLTVDWTGRRLTQQFGALTFVVGSGPTPPPPPPPPPGPTDPFTLKLQAAWAAETAADRAEVGKLIQLYRQSVQTAHDPGLTLCKSLFDVMHQTRLDSIKEALPKVRGVITAELDSVLPRSVAAPLDKETRDLCSRTFARVADSLTAACK